jgi:beta-lactamase family protein
MRSPRFAPAGLLVGHAGVRVMFDGGPGAEPSGRLDAWLVTDARSELIARIRQSAAAHGLTPRVGTFRQRGLDVEPRSVVHTKHPTYGYHIRAGGRTVVWAPEFYRFPAWARQADLMFAEAAAWSRPIRFVGGVGGHAGVLAVAAAARRAGVKRLVFAHIGRPTLRALAQGATAPFGSFAADGQVFFVTSG